MYPLFLPENCRKLWDTLSDYVLKVTKDRDSSHGYDHMHQVAKLSLLIATELNINSNESLVNILIVAWFHDVADHKYDHDGTLQANLHQRLLDMFPEDPERVTFIENIINRISYSKEVKFIKANKPNDWKEVLGDTGCLIRDIVSDADKLEAIGKVGMRRCADYGRHYHSKDTPDEEIIKHVLRHAGEKLLLLKSRFIRTEPGKIMAEPLHTEMEECILHIEDFVKECSN